MKITIPNLSLVVLESPEEIEARYIRLEGITSYLLAQQKMVLAKLCRGLAAGCSSSPLIVKVISPSRT